MNQKHFRVYLYEFLGRGRGVGRLQIVHVYICVHKGIAKNSQRFLAELFSVSLQWYVRITVSLSIYLSQNLSCRIHVIIIKWRCTKYHSGTWDIISIWRFCICVCRRLTVGQVWPRQDKSRSLTPTPACSRKLWPQRRPATTIQALWREVSFFFVCEAAPYLYHMS